MAIDELIELIPAGKGKVDSKTRDAVEKGLGLSLPSDYWDFIATYGAGSFIDYVEDDDEDDFFGGDDFSEDEESEDADSTVDDDDDSEDDEFGSFDSEDKEGVCEIPMQTIVTDKDFSDFVKRLCLGLQDTQSTWETEYALHPSRPGLLPFARDEEGGVLAWYTDGDADEWPVLAKSRLGEWERFDFPLTSFLARAFQGKISPEVWNLEGPKKWNLEQLRFIPRD